MQCPKCRTESEGRFCPSCGVPLSGATCGRCGAALLPGARYCTQCGDAVRRSGQEHLPWFIAALAGAALVVVLLLPVLRGDERAVTPPPIVAPPGMTGSGSPPPLTGTMREQADRLFNRVMQEREAGNMQQAAFFLPMAVDAYRSAGVTDADGLYHLSILETANGEPAAGRATAERILTDSPNHLLGLAAAADAAVQVGDSAAARNYYQRFLDNFESESTKQLQEYIDHARILPDYRSTAREFVGG